MLVATLTRDVRSKDSIYRFVAEVHRSESPDAQVIDAGFYEKWVGSVHEGTHHELLLTEAPSFEETGSNVGNHVYTHQDTGQKFVCYTPQLKTLEDTAALYNWWCIGMVYSLENAHDFADVIGEHPDDFPEVMESQYGIKIVE